MSTRFFIRTKSIRT